MPRIVKIATVAKLTVALGLGAAPALAQSPASKLDRGHHLQTWQHPG